MASGKWLVASGLILLMGVQTAFAKKDKTAAVKDTTTKDSVTAAVIAEIEPKIEPKKESKKEQKKTVAKDTTIIAVKAVKKNEFKDETEVKIDGILEIGFDNNYKVNKKTTEYKKIGRAEVGASFRPVKKVRAEVGFEYNSKDSVPEIDKLYGQYNPLNVSTIRFGYMKKSFGLEERAGLDERFFHKRSIIHDSLKYFGFLDHDLTLQYRHELTKKLELRGGFSWTKDSTRYLQNYSAEYDDKKNNLILAAIIGHYLQPNPKKDNKDIRNTLFVSSLSYKRTDKLLAGEAELTYGSNPAIKSYYDKDATIFGARLKENFFINTGLNTLQQVIPVAEAVLYSSDFKKDSTDFTTQFRAGLTLGFAKKSAFQWRNNYGVVSKISNGEKELWRRRFDTELLVIF